MSSRRVSSPARLSPLQPGRRARAHRQTPAFVALTGALAVVAGAAAGGLASPLAGALAALAVVVLALVVAVAPPRRSRGRRVLR